MPWTNLFVERKEPPFDQDEGKDLRKISFAEAIREALDQALERDKRVFVMGQGVDAPGGLWGTTLDLHKKHGAKRVFDVPLSENALTGVAIGAALVGMRPVFVHNRPDFILLSMDQIVNHAAKWSYMFGGKVKVPMVIRSVICRGWGSAAQHSQALHSLFMHIPGLRLVMPSTAYDAKGLLISSIVDENPVIFLEHRWLFKHTGYVPTGLYSIPFGKGAVRKEGNDVTIIGISHMAVEAIRAAAELQKEGIDAEVIDLRTLKPLDTGIILESLKKTGRLIIADVGWKTGGVGAEISAIAAECGFADLKAPILRIGCLDTPTPSSYVLEEEFYPGVDDIVQAARQLLKK
ncbi:MAG: alpha-ketoacid dehydrogenase subunit beta [Candidatus Omnitrophota bacterium]